MSTESARDLVTEVEKLKAEIEDLKGCILIKERVLHKRRKV